MTEYTCQMLLPSSMYYKHTHQQKDLEYLMHVSDIDESTHSKKTGVSYQLQNWKNVGQAISGSGQMYTFSL